MFKKLLYISIAISLFLPIFPAKAQQQVHKMYLAGLAISDMGAKDQWHLEKISAPNAWNQTQGNKNVIVAVIDSGIDIDHPDLKNNFWQNPTEIPNNGLDDDNNGYIDDVYGWDFVENDNIPEPKVENFHSNVAVHHGTAVAGIISAEGNNAFAGAGISWHAKIMNLRAFNELGQSDTVIVQRAIEYAVKNGADIINMSFVGVGYSSDLEATIKDAYEKGVLMVAAAGNEASANQGTNLDQVKSYPVCFDGENENWVLGVAGIDMDDKRASFSNYGNSCIDVSAPATDIYSSLFHSSKDSDFSAYFGGKLNGTSMSAPQVSGAAALVKALHPNYTNKQLVEVLINSTDNIDGANPYYAGLLGKGRLNVLKAVNYEPISMEPKSQQEIKYVLSANKGEEPKLWLLDGKGEVKKDFYAFAPGFRGGINMALGDVDNDGMIEIVAGAGAGGGPHIRIFNLSGELESQFFAFDKKDRNGVRVKIGDIDGDGRKDILAISAKNGKLAKIFNQNGTEKGSLTFNLSPSKLALADVNNDEKDEIVTELYGSIKTFNFAGELLAGFDYGYNISISAGDLNNDGWAEIVITNGKAVKTYSYLGRLLSPGFKGADFISLGDRNGDNEYEILAKSKNAISLFDKGLNKIAEFYPQINTNNFSTYIVSR